MATSSVQIQISEPELKLLQTLVYQECGMSFDDRRIHFLQDRLQRRLKTTNLDSYRTRRFGQSTDQERIAGVHNHCSTQ